MELLKGKKLYKEIKHLNVDFHDYLRYMSDEDSISAWKGVSIQQEAINEYEINQRACSLEERTLAFPNPPQKLTVENNFTELVKLLIDMDISNKWIFLHDNNRKKWILNKGYSSLPNERMVDLFKNNKVDLNYRGAFLLSKFSLKKILPNLIVFPYYSKGEDINLLGDKNDFIIRFTHHFSVDFISINGKKIENISTIAEQMKIFKIMVYR